MSAITFDWASPKAEIKSGIPQKAVESISREAEFRLALEGYIADYTTRQRRCAEAVDSAGWVVYSRRALDAFREIWLFSAEICRDWRQPR